VGVRAIKLSQASILQGFFTGTPASCLLPPALLTSSSLPRQSFEALNARAVAVVVDPVQSVKGKVVIDAFRLISPQVGRGVCI
jgi:hypothetical protein